MNLWQPDDLIALLSWLDLCIKLEVDFNSTIERYLSTRSQESNPHEPFTLRQIKQKLGDTSRAYKPPGPGLLTLLEVGSSCIPGLPVDIQENIEKKMMEYEESDFVSSIVASSRRSAFDHKEKDDVPSSNCLNLVENKDIEGQRIIKEKAVITLALDDEHGSSNIARNLKLTQVQRKVQCESIPGTSTIQLKINTLKQRHKALMTRKEEEIKKLRLKWQEETYELAQQQSKSMQTILDLRADIKHRELATKTSESAGKNPLEDTMFQYMHQNWSLLQRVQEMKKLLGFCQRTPEQSQDWIQQFIREGMATIQCEMADLLNGHDHSASVLVPVVQQESDLGCLIRSIFGNSSGEEIVLFRRCIAKYGSEPEVIVRAFASAALKEWVFMSNFPGFAKRNQLLDSYRKVVIINDGWRSAHNLEVAAYQSLMDEPSFKSTTIPKLAAELAARLSKALAPLFSVKVEETPKLDQWWWGQNSDVVASRNFRLVGLFATALAIKAKTVLVDNSFEFVVYPPGIRQSADTGGEPVEIRDKDNADRKLPSWIYSSIHMYRAAISVPSDVAADAQLTSRNFVQKSTQDRRAGMYEATVCIASEGPRTPSTVDELKDVEDNGKTVDEGLHGNPAQTFVCKMCKSVYKSNNGFVLHGHRAMCGRCSKCGEICAGKNRFVQHLKEQHPLDRDARLDNSWWPNGNTLQIHEREDRPDSIISRAGKSPVRAAEGSSRQSPEEESDTHQNSSKIGPLVAPGGECNKCGKRYAYLGSLDRHYREEACGKCLDCNMWFETRDLLLVHNSMEHASKSASTNDGFRKETSTSFNSDSTTSDNRISSNRGSGDAPFSPVREASRKRPCDEKDLISLSSLSSLSSGDGNKTYKCAMCMEKFQDPCDREEHSRSHACELEGHRAGKDDVDSTGKATCKQCGSMFNLSPPHKRRRLSGL